MALNKCNREGGCLINFQQAIDFQAKDVEISSQDLCKIIFNGTSQISYNPNTFILTITVHDGETTPFATGEAVKNTYLGSGAGAINNPLIGENELNNKQDRLSNEQINNINNIPNKQDKLSDQQIINISNVPNKLDIANLSAEIQVRIQPGNNITIDQTNDGIVINSTGGGGGDFTCNDLNSCKTLLQQIIAPNLALKQDKLSDQQIINISNVPNKQNITDNNLITVNKNIVPAINEILSELNIANNNITLKQNINDNNLLTTNKTIVGAINEVNTKALKPEFLYKNDFKIFSGFDNGQIFTLIDDLIIYINSKCGDRGSCYFQLWLRAKADGNKRYRGYIWRHYNQIEIFYEMKLMPSNSLVSNFWLSYLTATTPNYTVSLGNLTWFIDNAGTVINAHGDCHIAGNGNMTEGIMTWSESSAMVCRAWNSDFPMQVVPAEPSHMQAALSLADFVINMGFQLGYTDD